MVAALTLGSAYFSTWGQQAEAAPMPSLITFYFTGVIDSIPFGQDFFVGHPVRGSYTFEASTPPTLHNAGFAEYLLALTDFQVTVGSESYSSTIGDISVRNDQLADPGSGLPLYMDQYLVSTGTIVGNPLRSGATVSFVQLDVRDIVEDAAPDLLADEALPTDPVDLTQASEAVGRIALSSGDQAEFVLTSLTALSAKGTATIDGVFGWLEWDNAASTSFLATVHAPNGEETTTPATVFVMNDAKNLYLGVKVKRSDLGNSGVDFVFDNDNSSDLENGDDSLSLDAGAHLFSDNVRTNQPPCPSSVPGACGFADTDLGGTRDGEGAAYTDGVFAYYEISHPLDSIDNLHDFSLSGGDETGFQLRYFSCLSQECAETFFPGPGPFDPRATVVVAQPPIMVDLSVTNDTDIGYMAPGDHVLYRITVENVKDDGDPEPEDAPGVVVTIPLPSELAFVSVDPATMCTYRLGTHVVTCELGTLAPAETVEVFLVAKIDLLARDEIDIIATATFDGVDPYLLNNSAPQTTYVKAYQDLLVTKVGNPNPVVAGFPLTYTIEVHNLGPHVATDLTVLDQFAPGLAPADMSQVWLSSWGDTGCTAGANFESLQCNLGDIEPGDTAQVVVSFDVPATLSGWFSNTATAWANEEEVQPADNTWTDEVYVAPSVNTPVGSGNTVHPTDTDTGTPDLGIEIWFPEVTQAGSTTVTKTASGTPPPDGFSLGDPPVYFDFETDAVFVPTVQICIDYVAAGITFSGEPRFFHSEGGAWVDRTTFDDPVNGIICAVVDALSRVALFAVDELAVGVDIKPGGNANSINLESTGLIPVAILSEGGFDATDVDAGSVLFGPSGASPAHSGGHAEDVDGDGDLDLMLHFDTQRSGITRSDTNACLTGKTEAGLKIRGCDSIRIVDR